MTAFPRPHLGAADDHARLIRQKTAQGIERRRAALDALRRAGGTLSVARLAAAAGVDAPGARLVEHMRHDKKASGGVLPFLLARGIGRTFLDRSVDLADVSAFLEEERCRTA